MKQILLFSLFFLSFGLHAQNDTLPDDGGSLLDLLGTEEPTTEYATAAFKTNRVVNLHSLENTAGGVLDLKIQHRFGSITDGYRQLWGLDQATMRIGFDYGINDRLQIGIGRSSYEKVYDGYFKYKVLRQSTGKKKMPVTVAFLGTTARKTVKWNTPEAAYKSVHRNYYTWQLIVGRKFSERFTFQVSPTVVHRNLVPNRTIDHDIYFVGLATRYKLTKRTALNLEYMPLVSGRLAPGYQNSWSVGFDIETGGHVFQLHFTNSLAMIEKGFLTETVRNPSRQMIHFGFNLSRVFTVNQVGKD